MMTREEKKKCECDVVMLAVGTSFRVSEAGRASRGTNGYDELYSIAPGARSLNQLLVG